MKQKLAFIVIAAILLSCHSSNQQEQPVKTSTPIEGTWQLISGTIIVKNDTTVTDYTKNQKMIKIINATHFAFFKHDLTHGKDSAIYESGAGKYTLVDNQYTEHLDFCNAREWEGHDFKFTVIIKKDTLLQTGIEKLDNLGVDRFIIEKYIRVK